MLELVHDIPGDIFDSFVEVHHDLGIEQAQVEYFIAVVVIELLPSVVPLLEQAIQHFLVILFGVEAVPLVRGFPVLDLVFFGAIECFLAAAAVEVGLLGAHFAPPHFLLLTIIYYHPNLL